ncbi:MAG: YitT family protein [Bacteroidaceae bacterium]|jgi:uncharacterized membrane-anchored protein YitT (DUF2179 family)|nr:YitT family protein [Bacteroidaceae bacterium]
METISGRPSPPVPRKKQILREIHDYLFVAIGILMYAVGWTIFELPIEITGGGVPGISSVVYYATGIPVQYTYFTINGILLILSVIVLGWKFSVKTIFACIMMTLVLPIIQNLVNDYHFNLDIDPFASAILGGAFCGAGIGVAFSNNGSLGGTDIIAAIINKYRDISLGRVGLYLDVIIVSCSYFVVSHTENVFYGYVVLVVTSLMLDFVVNRSTQSVQFFIISEKYEEIAKLINAMPTHRGCTVIDGTGFYSGRPVKLLFVLTRKREATQVFRLIKDTDPMAFVSQANVNGVYGNGFDRIKVK